MHTGLDIGKSCYKIVDPRLSHIVTITILPWLPVFTRPEIMKILLGSLRHLVANGLKSYAYAILENHLHLVVQPVRRNRKLE